MHRLRSGSPRSGMLRAAGQLASGAAAAQVVSFFASLAYARLFAPEEMGLYALVLAVEGMFGGVLSLRYEAMLVTEPSTTRALALCRVCLRFVAVVGTVAALGCAAVYHLLRGETLLLAVPMLGLLWLRGLIGVLDSWNNRSRDYGLMAGVTVARALAQAAVSVVLGALGFGAWGLVLGHCLGLVCGVYRQAGPLLRLLPEMRAIPREAMRSAIRTHRRQALYATPAAFANRFAYQLIPLLLEALSGPAALGCYTMANKALSLPLNVLSGSMSRVFFREAGDAYHRTGQFRRPFRRVSLFMALAAAAMSAAVVLLAPGAFRLLYGARWADCGTMARLMVPMLAARLVASTVAGSLQLTGRQRQELALQGMMAAMTLGCGVLGARLGWPMEALLGSVSLCLALGYGAVWCCAARAAGVQGAAHPIRRGCHQQFEHSRE